MSWNMGFDDAMAQARRHNIPPEDAAEMWREYVEIAAAVRAREITDEAGMERFEAFCTRLATATAMRRMSRPTPAKEGP